MSYSINFNIFTAFLFVFFSASPSRFQKKEKHFNFKRLENLIFSFASYSLSKHFFSVAFDLQLFKLLTREI